MWEDMQMSDPVHELGRAHKPDGWKYRSLRLGPIKLPCYASPEAQLLLVSFVCFLCPGKTLRLSRRCPVVDKV